MRAEQIAARVWPDRELDIEPLGGGITNHNFVVRVDEKAYVLRIAGADTELLGIDRAAEHEAARVAAGLGVGPEVVDFVEGSLITCFVEGVQGPGRRDPPAGGLREVARLLRRIHEGPAVPRQVRLVSGRRDLPRRRPRRTASAIPAQYDEAKARADEIERTLGPRPEQPCHNDLLNAELHPLADGIRIVDWEYAGMGDPFFDLANFSVNNELDRGRERRSCSRPTSAR